MRPTRKMNAPARGTHCRIAENLPHSCNTLWTPRRRNWHNPLRESLTAPSEDNSRLSGCIHPYSTACARGLPTGKRNSTQTQPAQSTIGVTYDLRIDATYAFVQRLSVRRLPLCGQLRGSVPGMRLCSSYVPCGNSQPRRARGKSADELHRGCPRRKRGGDSGCLGPQSPPVF